MARPLRIVHASPRPGRVEPRPGPMPLIHFLHLLNGLRERDDRLIRVSLLELEDCDLTVTIGESWGWRR